MRKNKKIWNTNIICECGYQNKIENVKRYGVCKLCGKVLDEKAKFKYDMNKKLRLWRDKI